jgi:anthranilate phosphoribosyltransferase
MEELGYRFSTERGKLAAEIESAYICFLHATLFHPALKTVGPIRKNLAMRTFFNMLGPMANPANPAYQLVGVYNPEMARIYNYLLQLNNKPFTIIHSLDGYDEISLTSDTKVITQEGEKIMTPEQLGKRMVNPADIHGGNSVAEAAGIFKRILSGKGSWSQHAVVLANAAMALLCTGTYKNYEDAYFAAVESFESGRANQALEKLISLQ